MTTVSSTSSPSTSSGTLSSPGIGSGLNVTSIVDSLMAINNQPLTNLQKQASTLNTEISAYGQLSSLTSAMGDAASTLSSVALWKSVAATSSNASAVSATASTGAAAGSYSVSVQQLAGSQTISSAAVTDSSATLGTGTLTIQLGTYSGSGSGATFTAQSGSSPVAITIDSSNTSLASIASQINSANAGVSATIINDASGARLALTSTNTGTNNAFKITTSNLGPAGSSGSDLSALNFDATAASSPMTLNQKAQNATATVNGIAVSSYNNTLSGISNGLTLNLQQTTTSPVTISVSPDTATITKDVNAFVTAYNALNSYIHTETAYDPTSKIAGTLQGDFATTNLLSQLHNVVNNPSSASSTFSSLSDAGISIQKDGSLALDSTKFSAGLANLPEMQKLLAANTGLDASSGYFTRFFNMTQAVLTPTIGSIATGSSALQAMLKDNSSQQASLQTRLAAMKTTLLAQYQALDTTMAQNTSLATYMTNSLSSMTSSSSSSSG